MDKMKKFLPAHLLVYPIFLLFASPTTSAQAKLLNVYQGGEPVFSIPVSEVDSINFVKDVPAPSEYYLNYAGTPYVHPQYHPEPGHPVPGKVMLAYFDAGGEGISWHDGSPGNTGGFRAETDVDSKATNGGDGDKPTPLYPDAPPLEYGMHYLAWTADGEWVTLTLDILETGRYEVYLFYSANGQNARASFSIDGVVQTPGGVALPTTGYYHQWYEVKFAGISLERGRRVLRFDETRADGTNFAYLTFKRVE
jgi:hypothetical protein